MEKPTAQGTISARLRSIPGLVQLGQKRPLAAAFKAACQHPFLVPLVALQLVGASRTLGAPVPEDQPLLPSGHALGVHLHAQVGERAQQQRTKRLHGVGVTRRLGWAAGGSWVDVDVGCVCAVLPGE